MITVKPADKITIYVKDNPSRRTKALVTYISTSGVVYFRPLKTLHFKVYPNTTLGTEAHLWAGNVYSTSDIENLVFTGSFKDLLGIALQESDEEATFEAAPTLKLSELPSHDYGEARYTTEEVIAGGESRVVDRVGEFFKAFSSNSQHHHFMNPSKKLDTTLTSFCEDAKKKSEDFKEAVFIADRVINHGDIEYTVRMMLKAGLTPHQITEEIQRQFYNAMVTE